MENSIEKLEKLLEVNNDLKEQNQKYEVDNLKLKLNNQNYNNEKK